MTIVWQKEEDVGVMALDHVYNYHVDNRLFTADDCMLWETYNYPANRPVMVSAITLLDQIHHTAYIMFDKSGAVELGSPKHQELEKYATRQYHRLAGKLRGTKAASE